MMVSAEEGFFLDLESLLPRKYGKEGDWET